MSMIHEALKKAGRPVSEESKKTEFHLPPLKRDRRMNWGPVFVLAILAFITTPLVAPLFHSSYQNKTASPNMKSQFGVEEAPLMPISRPTAGLMGALPNFSLNGLVYSNEGSYCLINGKIVKVGQMVGGATLIKVTPSEAVLDFKGEKIVLPASV